MGIAVKYVKDRGVDPKKVSLASNRDHFDDTAVLEEGFYKNLSPMIRISSLGPDRTDSQIWDSVRLYWTACCVDRVTPTNSISSNFMGAFSKDSFTYDKTSKIEFINDAVKSRTTALVMITARSQSANKDSISCIWDYIWEYFDHENGWVRMIESGTCHQTWLRMKSGLELGSEFVYQAFAIPKVDA